MNAEVGLTTPLFECSCFGWIIISTVPVVQEPSSAQQHPFQAFVTLYLCMIVHTSAVSSSRIISLDQVRSQDSGSDLEAAVVVTVTTV